MATTPQGDNAALRSAVVRNMARRIVQQRAAALPGASPRRVRSLTVRPMPGSTAAKVAPR